MGLLHGSLIMFSFVGSWFTDVRIYAFPNSGGWYDFGYLLGAASFLGGSEESRRRSRRRRKSRPRVDDDEPFVTLTDA
jgi:hypothetical protein